MYDLDVVEQDAVLSWESRCAAEEPAVRQAVEAVVAHLQQSSGSESDSDDEPVPVPEPEPLSRLGLGNLEELDVLLHICSFLAARELGRLACVSRCFGRKTEWVSAEDTEPSLPRSLVSESARQWVLAREVWP